MQRRIFLRSWLITKKQYKTQKVAVGIKLDNDVLGWFKAQGKGYQTRINTVLRRYYEAHRKAG